MRAHPLPLLVAVALGAGLASTAATPTTKAPAASLIIDVAARPAFLRPPGGGEKAAQRGQRLLPDSVLRTQSPGRLQVRLPDGRSFRLGGDAELRLAPGVLDLRRGQIIAWVNPGRKGSEPPLRIRTRVATASIVGTTVFIEADPGEVKFLSWEGQVTIDTDTGKRIQLNGGDLMVKKGDNWVLPRPLTAQEARARRGRNPLFRSFSAPMETLPEIERTIDNAPASEASR